MLLNGCEEGVLKIEAGYLNSSNFRKHRGGGRRGGSPTLLKTFAMSNVPVVSMLAAMMGIPV